MYGIRFLFPVSREAIRQCGLMLCLVIFVTGFAEDASSQISLVRDINPSGSEGHSFPRTFAELGSGDVVFEATAYDGRFLFVTDGTLAGTSQVTDRVQVVSGTDIVVFGGFAYFAGETETEGIELWRSDGTDAGTTLVADITPGSSFPSGFTIVSGALYFSATGPDGKELYVTDGTTAGTVQVADIRPGSFGSTPNNLTEFGGLLYFTASDGSTGTELWQSDGTSAGTSLVLDIRPGSGGSSPVGLTEFGGSLFFFADDGTNGREFWQSDGTTLGTVLLADLNPTGGAGFPVISVSNGRMWFAANDGTNGTEPWSSDGTALGTLLLGDLNPGTASSSPLGFKSAGGRTLFRANDGVSGSELWSTDGTGAGTSLLADIEAGSGASNPIELVEAGGLVFFAATDSTTGQELWISDGTALGTQQVEDLNPGTAGAFNQFGTLEFGAIGSDLYFQGNDGSTGFEVWKSDGTALGTTPVSNIWTGTDSSGIRDFVTLGSEVFFGAREGLVQTLFRSDGTEVGTVPVTEIRSGDDADVKNLIVMGGVLYFSADDGLTGDELWRSDGSAAGTFRVADIRPGLDSSAPTMLGVLGSELFFSANDGSTGSELWKTDGTAAGTVQVLDIAAGAGGSGPALSAVLNGELYFRASDGTTGLELWKTDGTAAGTMLVKDLNPGSASGFTSALVVLNGEILFGGNDGTGVELWKTDGTDPGTVLVRDIRTNSSSGSNPKEFNVLGGSLYFFANDGVNGEELWGSDGTTAGTNLVLNIGPGSIGIGGFSATTMVATSTQLFFLANDGVTGRELWKSDGTAAGTSIVTDLFPGDDWAFNSFTLVLGTANDTVYFAAEDGVHGIEPWTSDGTAAGTTMIADIAPGAFDSDPSAVGFAFAGGNVFFAASDEAFGEELRATFVPEPGFAMGLLLGWGGLLAARRMNGKSGWHRRVPLEHPSALVTGIRRTGVACLLFVGLSYPITSSALVFNVNSSTGAGDADLTDDICDTGNAPVTEPSGASAPECTLYAAIEQANASTTDARDRIEFNSEALASGPGAALGVVTISLGVPLPPVTGPLDIDGRKTPGYVAGGPPLIALQPLLVGAMDGLTFEVGSEDSSVRGVAMHGFSRALRLNDSSGFWVESCSFGYVERPLSILSGVLGNFVGVEVRVRAEGTDIGARNEGEEWVGFGNTFAGNQYGIVVHGSDSRIVGNSIGTNPSGNAADTGGLNPQPTGNWTGIYVSGAQDLEIGAILETSEGPEPRGNVISGNLSDGIEFYRVSETPGVTSVVANQIGTNSTGDGALGNLGNGIQVEWLTSDSGDGPLFIGRPGAPNVISGNGYDGIHFDSQAMGTLVIQDNLIGTDLAGLQVIGNGRDGVGGRDFVGPGLLQRNTIGGNGETGVHVPRGAEWIVSENWIGVNPDGVTLGNEGAGISSGGDRLVARANTIGANETGIKVERDSRFIITDNFIGTNAASDNIGNLGSGILGEWMDPHPQNRIGGIGEGNVIGWNGESGISLSPTSGLAHVVTLIGNDIGLDRQANPIPNGEHGIHVLPSQLQLHPFGQNVFTIGSDFSTLADAVIPKRNRISFNGGRGVAIEGSPTSIGHGAVAIRGNEIFQNSSLSIDLNMDGPTANDADDADIGANWGQNHPELNAAGSFLDYVTGELVIDFVVPSPDGASTYPLLVDFYISDSSGDDLVEFVGAASYKAEDAELQKTVRIDPQFPFPAEAQLIVATVTDSAGRTSELSAPITVPEPDFAFAAAVGALGLFVSAASGSKGRPQKGARCI